MFATHAFAADALKHWSFIAPQRLDPPVVKHTDWPRNAIDRFVLAKLEAAGLSPEPEADRTTLIRRVSLDLIGLPPTPAEVDAFVSDRSPEAYEKVVDRLLASPRYGEHWASMWLDLARYADSKGYEKDNHRDIWRYRDWVIEAYNVDMPYDEFTLEQVAGDLVPGATTDQLIATAFNRNTMTNDEGGTDDEEFRVAAVKDRVDTTVQVWMGLTMGCAKCHSHKYDPITQTEYYGFYAFFNQTEDSDKPDDRPRIPTPSIEQTQRLAALTAQIAAIQKERDTITPDFVAARTAWEKQIAGPAKWLTLAPMQAVSAGGAKLTVQDDGSILAAGTLPDTDTYTITASLPGSKLTAVRIETLTDPSLPRGGPGRSAADPNFVINELTLVLREGGADKPIKLAKGRADFEQDNWPIGGAIDGVDKTGWAVSPQKGQPHAAMFELAQPIDVTAGATLTFTIRQLYGHGLVLGHVRLSASSADVKTLAPSLGVDVAQLAAIDMDKRTTEQQAMLDDAFRAVYPATKTLTERLTALQKEADEAGKAATTMPIMRELPDNQQRKTFIQVRGNFLDHGDEVHATIPAAFGPLPKGAPANRLGVAQWFVDPANPLTARVAVNRLWARLFGMGIVETEEDFGTQGTPPSDQPLLDFMAIEFRDTLGWSRKRMLKEMVMSAAYRQSSKLTPAKLEADPRNVLISRGPRFRLTAEQVRDQALAASGLLSAKMYGPPVMPPQPPGVWKAIYSGAQWQTPDNEDRYRRALYTYWRRTSPYPSMLNFDAGSREVCQMRRIRTNTPLAALVTLNDEVYLEAAGALARKMIAEGGPEVGSRLSIGYRRLLARAPRAEELAALRELIDQVTRHFADDPSVAAALIESAHTAAQNGESPIELATWTTAANVIMNLDETVIKP
ncbi:MAG: DUF1549 domain-containing protein [Planctomycetes bacterium]|nr:DUF1549 domain-containing protein [Planctomycetota bacterium]